MEGYCNKCKSKREIVDAVEGTSKNHRVVLKGVCECCGEPVVKIVSSEESPPPQEPPLPK